jgi:hypothetical protein
VKGIIFEVVEEVVIQKFGEDTWDELLADAGVDGVWTTLGSYPDEQLGAIVAAAADRLGVSTPDVLRLVGRAAFSGLVAHHPELLDGHQSSRSVLMGLNAIIHPEVMKLYPDATVPWFGVTEQGELMEIVYRSDRSLGPLAEGLAQGAGDHFGEVVEVLEVDDRGAECRFTIRVRPADRST